MCDIYAYIYICTYTYIISIAINLKVHFKVFFSMDVGILFYDSNQIN